MKKPEISPDFTLDDIEKIREYAGERFMSVSEEDFREEMRDSSSRMQEKIERIRRMRITHGKSKIEHVV